MPAGYRLEPPGSQPPLLHPDYRSTVPRAPGLAPVAIPSSLSEITGPVFGHNILGELDNDMIHNFARPGESAIGPPRFASGMPGLQSAFLRAGARGVIATLWPIEDVLAREFSQNFYERYTETRSAARALSETQRQWLAATPGIGDEQQRRRRITALAHGFFTL